MKKIAEQGILYDFYGALLTEHQQRICEAYIYDDLSLSEIAQQEGISRQGVHDLLGRCFTRMKECDDKLHLMSQFERCGGCLKELRTLLEKSEETKDGGRKITAEDLDKMQRLFAELNTLIDNNGEGDADGV